MEFTYGIGDRVVVVGGDDVEPQGVVVGGRHHGLPNYLGDKKEEQVNVKLDSGYETGFIPITLVCSIDRRPITERTHDPVQGLPRAYGHCPASERPESELAKLREDLRRIKINERLAEITKEEYARAAKEREESAKAAMGIAMCCFKGCDKPAAGLASTGGALIDACEDHADKVCAAYIDPEPKNPDALAGVVDELEYLATWMQNTLGAIKMRELRSRVIKAAITVKGCTKEWQRQQEYERSKKPDYQNLDVPMPGRNSSDFHSIRKELESIAYSVDNYLVNGEHPTEPSIDKQRETIGRLGNLSNVTHRLQELWLADEESIGQLMQKRPDYQVPMHKLLFFGPDDGGAELSKDMEREGVLPESKMEDRLNHFAEHGWHTAHVSYNEHFVMKQWRVMLEKP